MEREANYTAVGAFVLLVAVMAGMFVYWYSEGRDRRSYVPYEIYFTGSVTGLYDLYATWPDGNTESLFAAFQIKPGIGPRLETRVIAPSDVRPGRQYGMQVEYANTGDANMPAPLLRIAAQNATRDSTPA